MGLTAETTYEQLPSWLRTLDAVEVIDISASHIGRFQKDAFPRSLVILEAGLAARRESDGGGD